jgi:hypothetical protein
MSPPSARAPEVLERHSILRTAFVWERLDRPMQVVRKRVELPLVSTICGRSPPEEQRLGRRSLRRVRAAARLRSQPAPLLRFSVFRLGDDAPSLIWTMHHLIIDGWSLPLLVNEIFTLYEAYSRGATLTLDRPRPYGDYIAWLKKQGSRRTEAFWRELQGFSAPTPFGVDRPAPAGTRGGPLRGARLVCPRASPASSPPLPASTASPRARSFKVPGPCCSPATAERRTCSSAPPSRAAPRPSPASIAWWVCSSTRSRCASRPAAISPCSPGSPRCKQQVELREHEHTPLVEVHGLSEVPRGDTALREPGGLRELPRGRGPGEPEGRALAGRARDALPRRTIPSPSMVSLRRELVGAPELRRPSLRCRDRSSGCWAITDLARGHGRLEGAPLGELPCSPAKSER